MRTRREQMQAYRFVIRRIVAAVLSGEPETLDRPMRRLGISVFVSTMIAVLVFAGFGVYGLLTNQGSEPDEAGELIVVREDATVYVSRDGVLHEVPNLASGLLILGNVGIRQVSKESLLDLPRGVELGIPDAPSALPDGNDLLGLPWQVCSAPSGPVDLEPKTTVVIDRSLTSASSEIGQQALYVASPSGSYLLWNNTRFRIRNQEQTEVALVLPNSPINVGEQLISSISIGPELAPPRVDGDSRESDLVPGAEVGDLFAVDDDQHYLLTTDGFGRINEVSVELLKAENVQATALTSGEVADVGTSEDLEDERFPATVPTTYPATQGSTICTAYDGRSGGPLGTTIQILDSAQELSPEAGAIPLYQTERDRVRPADQAVIAGGRGALVRETPHAEDEPREGESIYLITDQGRKYPLVGDAVEALGYGDVEPVDIPADLLALIPRGPTLSSEEAGQPLVGSSPAADPG